MRFLDMLALEGNVRCAAGEAGVSHETAYRARRSDAAFAALWDAALVHARAWAEQELASRAFDGVEAPIVHGGEIVGFRTVHDPRWLLGHLARLDRAVEERGQAAARAERFDELLAQYAGHPEPEGFRDAAGLWDEDRHARRDDAGPRVPTRREYVAWRSDQAAEGVEACDEDRVMARAAEIAGEEWDRWHDGAAARVARIVAPALVPSAERGHPLPDGACAESGDVPGPDHGGSAAPTAPGEREGEGQAEGELQRPENPPFEVKSAPAGLAAPDRVNSVNPPTAARSVNRGGACRQVLTAWRGARRG